MRGRFIPLLLAAVIFAVALGVTYGLWKNSRVEEVQKLQKEFDFRARETIERIGQRMATYEQVARGTKGFLLGDI
ncbi:MAG: domain S-box protein, partial [Paucimonas sp.]|nr:domain S-box protein [Paucimonas sp.]